MTNETVPADSHSLKWATLTELGEAYRNTISGREERSAYNGIFRARVPGGWFVRFYLHGDSFSILIQDTSGTAGRYPRC